MKVGLEEYGKPHQMKSNQPGRHKIGRIEASETSQAGESLRISRDNGMATVVLK